MATDASVTFRPNQAALDRMLNDPNGMYGRWLARKGLIWQNAARVKANVDTGLMRSRIEFRLEVEAGVLVGVLAARTSYAVFVHNGTRYYPGNPFLMDAVRENL